MSKMSWYILQVLSNKEKSVQRMIEQYVQALPEEERVHFGECIVPEEEVTEVKKSKKKVTSKKKLLPGYILLQLDLPEDDMMKVRRLCSRIANFQGVGGFVGSSDGRPRPVSEKELEGIFMRSQESTRSVNQNNYRNTVVIDLEEGDSVRVIEGPFKELYGVVENVNAEKRKVRVRIEIFGMPTPVELDVFQVEKS